MVDLFTPGPALLYRRNKVKQLNKSFVRLIIIVTNKTTHCKYYVSIICKYFLFDVITMNAVVLAKFLSIQCPALHARTILIPVGLGVVFLCLYFPQNGAFIKRLGKQNGSAVYVLVSFKSYLWQMMAASICVCYITPTKVLGRTSTARLRPGTDGGAAVYLEKPKTDSLRYASYFI